MSLTGRLWVSPPEHYDLAVTGVAHLSHVGLPYTPGRFPMAEVIELPIAKSVESIYSQAYWELYKKGYFDNDFKEVKVLWLAVVGPYDYQMAEKPVLTFDDMKGLKMRASGKAHTEVPFLLAMIVALALLIAFPQISLWLPNTMG